MHLNFLQSPRPFPISNPMTSSTMPESRRAVDELPQAKELNAEKGDTVEKIRSLNGWSWCRNLRTGDEGWIPDEIIGTAE